MFRQNGIVRARAARAQSLTTINHLAFSRSMMDPPTSNKNREARFPTIKTVATGNADCCRWKTNMLKLAEYM